MAVERIKQFPSEGLEEAPQQSWHKRFQDVLFPRPQESPTLRSEERAPYPEDFGLAVEDVAGEVFERLPFVTKIETPTASEDGLGKIDRWVHFKDGDYETRIGLQVTVAGSERAVKKLSSLPEVARPSGAEWTKYPLAFLRISDPGMIHRIESALAAARAYHPAYRAIDFLQKEDEAGIVRAALPSLRWADEGQAFLSWYTAAVGRLEKEKRLSGFTNNSK